MFQCMSGFSEFEIDKIHNAAMEILQDIGVAFHDAEALNIFKKMSFEKFLIDEKNCGYVRHLLKPMEVSDATIAMDQIKRAGIDGAYLISPETFSQFKNEFFIPKLAVRGDMTIGKKPGKNKSGKGRHNTKKNDLLPMRSLTLIQILKNN